MNETRPEFKIKSNTFMPQL